MDPELNRYEDRALTQAPDLWTRRSLLAAGVAMTAWFLVPGKQVRAIQENSTPPAMGTPAVPDAWFAVYGQRGTTVEGWPIEVVLATPDYLKAAGRWDAFAEFMSTDSIMVLTLRKHGGALPIDAAPVGVAMRVDGLENLTPSEIKVIQRDAILSEEAHFFVNTTDSILGENHLIEIELQGSGDSAPVVFFWITPMVAPGIVGTPVGEPAAPTPEATVDPVDALETALPSEEIEICAISRYPSFA